jgi:hypothetical protein
MAEQVINLGTGPDTPGGDTQHDAFLKTKENVAELYSEVTAAVPQFEVGAGQTLAVTRAAHQGATVTLAGAAATISFSATAQGNGFVFSLKNRTGSTWTVPAFAGGTREYSKGAAHTLVESGGDAFFEVYTRNSAMYVSVIGDTA